MVKYAITPDRSKTNEHGPWFKSWFKADVCLNFYSLWKYYFKFSLEVLTVLSEVISYSVYTLHFVTATAKKYYKNCWTWDSLRMSCRITHSRSGSPLGGLKLHQAHDVDSQHSNCGQFGINECCICVTTPYRFKCIVIPCECRMLASKSCIMQKKLPFGCINCCTKSTHMVSSSSLNGLQRRFSSCI